MSKNQLYDGFPSHSDNAIMERFHETDWPDRKDLLDRLADERLRLLGQRLIYTDAADTMEFESRQGLRCGDCPSSDGRG